MLTAFTTLTTFYRNPCSNIAAISRKKGVDLERTPSTPCGICCSRSSGPGGQIEIGVYRGQTVTLWKLISRLLGFECGIGCVSPFTSAGDEVSTYRPSLDYYQDVRANHDHFRLPLPDFCREYSTSPVAREFIHRHEWDLIYIDGNHDYDVAVQDWQVCSESVASNGIIVLDDSALETDYHPPRFATAGHPGPSRVAREVSEQRFREILAAGHNRVFQRIA